MSVTISKDGRTGIGGRSPVVDVDAQGLVHRSGPVGIVATTISVFKTRNTANQQTKIFYLLNIDQLLLNRCDW